MKMDLLNAGVVNFGFRRSQRLKNLDRSIFGRLADLCGLNDLANFFQPTMLVRVLVFWTAGAIACVSMLVVAVGMVVIVTVLVRMVVAMLMWHRRPRRCLGMRMLVRMAM